MSLRKAISLGAFLFSLQAASIALRGQDPGPMHLQDSNLFLGQSKEPSTLLVLPKGLTQITLNPQSKGRSDYRDQNGNSFLNPSNYRKPLFRYAQLNMGFGLRAGFDVGFTLPNVRANSWYETPASYFTNGNRNGQILDRCNGYTGISDSWLAVQWQPVRLGGGRFQTAPTNISADIKVFQRRGNSHGVA